MRVSEQREHDVASRINVVHGNQQLPETWLTEIVRQQLHVAAREIVRFRCRDGRGSANQIPKLRERSGEQI